MTTTEAVPGPGRLDAALPPPAAPLGAGRWSRVLAVAAAGLPAMVLGWALVGWLALALVLFLVALPGLVAGRGERPLRRSTG